MPNLFFANADNHGSQLLESLIPLSPPSLMQVHELHRHPLSNYCHYDTLCASGPKTGWPDLITKCSKRGLGICMMTQGPTAPLSHQGQSAEDWLCALFKLPAPNAARTCLVDLKTSRLLRDPKQQVALIVNNPLLIIFARKSVQGALVSFHEVVCSFIWVLHCRLPVFIPLVAVSPCCPMSLQASPQCPRLPSSLFSVIFPGDYEFQKHYLLQWTAPHHLLF